MRRRVSKTLRAVVATPSRALNERLWRTPYSALLLHTAATESEEYETVPLQLHPILQELSMEMSIDQNTDSAVFTPPSSSSGSRTWELSNLLEINHENATHPPIKKVVFNSYIKHHCDTSEGCTVPCQGTSRDGGALNIKEFVDFFMQSLKGVCEAYAAAASHNFEDWWGDEFKDESSSFEGWQAQRLDANAEVAYFRKLRWEG